MKSCPLNFLAIYNLGAVGPVAYKLELSEAASIHLVFHVSQLKKVMGEHRVGISEGPYLTANHEWRAVPEETYGYLRNKAGSWDVLVSWKGLPMRQHGKAMRSCSNCFQIFNLRTR